MVVCFKKSYFILIFFLPLHNPLYLIYSLTESHNGHDLKEACADKSNDHTEHHDHQKHEDNHDHTHGKKEETSNGHDHNSHDHHDAHNHEEIKPKKKPKKTHNLSLVSSVGFTIEGWLIFLFHFIVFFFNYFYDYFIFILSFLITIFRFIRCPPF